MDPMPSRAWLPRATRPSSQRTATSSSVTLDRLGPGPLEQADPPAQEVVLEDRRDLGVLLGQHLLAADDQGDLGAEARRTCARTRPR